MTNQYAARLSEFLPSEQDLLVFAESSTSEALLSSFSRMTTWFNLLSDTHGNDQTIVLISAAHAKIIEIWILAPLGLIHSAYTALRTFVDICTSYTFYCSHPVEWTAVCENRANWEGRANIIDWNVNFTPTCREINRGFQLADTLDRNYRQLSSYIHGIPISGLPTLRGINKPIIPPKDLDNLVRLANETDEIMNLLFLSVFHRELSSLSTTDYRTITRGLDRRKLGVAGIHLPRV